MHPSKTGRNGLASRKMVTALPGLAGTSARSSAYSASFIPRTIRWRLAASIISRIHPCSFPIFSGSRISSGRSSRQHGQEKSTISSRRRARIFSIGDPRTAAVDRVAIAKKRAKRVFAIPTPGKRRGSQSERTHERPRARRRYGRAGGPNHPRPALRHAEVNRQPGQRA